MDEKMTHRFNDSCSSAGINACQRFEQSDSADFHKWYAILIGSHGMFLPTKAKIESGHKFRKHVDRALELSPNDPALYHLLGRFKFEVASLTWIEKKVNTVEPLIEMVIKN